MTFRFATLLAGAPVFGAEGRDLAREPSYATAGSPALFVYNYGQVREKRTWGG